MVISSNFRWKIRTVFHTKKCD